MHLHLSTSYPPARDPQPGFPVASPFSRRRTPRLADLVALDRKTAVCRFLRAENQAGILASRLMAESA